MPRCAGSRLHSRYIFREAFGLANRELGIANAPDAEFRIGSITKQCTALAILKLAVDRKLSLDDPISRSIEASPPAWREVTVRHLETHTSAIPNFTVLPDWVGQTWMGRSPEDLVDFVRDLLECDSGARFQYDNTGYVILGLIVQKASGQSLGDHL
jgi:D-alanyl-D-alanine carboxypeptidase